MRLALFGFPQTGKSTLFQLLTGVEPAAFGGRGEAQTGITKVPDPRLVKLREMYSPKKYTPATVEYLDLAGMEKGEAAKVLPLDQLRTADALMHVVRAFEDASIPHVEGPLDPARDVATMETEFILADHGVVEKRIEKLRLQVQKINKPEDKKELALMERGLAWLDEERPLREMELNDDERKTMRGYTFLSLKPLLIAVNAGEDAAAKLGEGAAAFGLEAWNERPYVAVVALSAKIEAEIAQLDDDDAASFREDLGIEEPALDRLIQASYALLGQVSFFTVGEDECRAWTIDRDLAARRAARAIHSDIERGFIRAEVIRWDALLDAGAWSAARDAGTLRLEGKEYPVQDGDVINFRFNV